MADGNLINIAGKVAQSGIQRDYSEDFSKAFEKTFKNEIDKKKAINDRIFKYQDELEYKGNNTGLTDVQKAKVNNFLVTQRKLYADAANEIVKIKDPQDPKYTELRDKMNSIRNSFANLAGQVEKYKESKMQFLTDHHEGLISDGNDLDTLDFASKVFTDGGDINVSENGELQFLNDSNNQFVSLGSIKKPFLKDKDGGTEITKLANAAYKAGLPLTGQRETVVKDQLRAILIKKGPESLKSLLSDGLIGGKINVDPELMKPENEDKLLEFALDKYMTGIKASAQQGYDELKKPKLDKNKTDRGFSNALRDEIFLATPVKNKAEAFANLAYSKPTAREIAARLNSQTKTSNYTGRREAYKLWLENESTKDEDGNTVKKPDNAASKKQFREQYPRDRQIFFIKKGQPPVAIVGDIHDPKVLFDMYLQNTNLSSKAKNYFLNQKGIEEQSRKTGVGARYNQ